MPTRATLQQWWTVSLEIICSPPSPFSKLSAPSLRSLQSTVVHEPPFGTSFAKSLLSFLQFSLSSVMKDNDRIYNMSMLLPGARPPILSPEEPSSLLERRRASLENTGREPTMNELKAFAETGLKGVKVELRSGEKSAFAKHLTTYLAGWGMDVSHIALDAEEFDTLSMTGSSNGDPWQLRRETSVRPDSGFGNPAETTSHSIPPIDTNVKPIHDSGSTNTTPSSTSIEPPANFIIVDDDIATLKRLLISYRAPSVLQYAPSLLNKRPQLSSRRTRSSNHIRQVTHAPSIIIHFASLTHYKAIKEAIQDAVATTKSTTLPEVLVVPKPAGPRRIITALWTALKRPTVDPSLAPIATSPTSPGVQYWTPRLSPAILNQQDFDSAAVEALGKDGNSSGPSRARTPPSYFSGAPVGHPPSPLGKISDEQVSYFSCVAETMDGTSPSEGMVVQSPNGRPAIFFQPLARANRPGIGTKKEGDSAEEEKKVENNTPPISPNGVRGSVSAPHEIGLGQDRRKTINSPSESPFFLPLGTPALSLDSFIATAKNRSTSGPGSPEIAKSPSLPPAESVSAFQRANSVSAASRIASPRAVSNNASPRSLISPILPASRPRATSPPISPRVDSPVFGAALARPLHGLNASPHRSVSLPSVLGRSRSRRNTVRKSPLPTVPPINVLIVEGLSKLVEESKEILMII